MNKALALLGGALAFGVAAEVLADVVPDRLNLALGLCALVLVGAVLVQYGFVVLPRAAMSLGIPFALLTVALIWRDSETIFALNLLGIAVLAVLATPRLRGVGWRRAGVLDYPRGALQLAGNTAAGAAWLVFTEIDWRLFPDRGPLHRARGVLVGLLAVTPVAAVLGGLLMDADPVFRSLMVSTFSLDLDWILPHVVPVFLWSWFAAGGLRLFFRSEAAPAAARDQWRTRLGITEIGVALVVLDLLFLTFVAVQLRHFLGVTGLSHSEYARQGFFQLVAVASLSLPVLLLADHALGPRDRATRRGFGLLASVMVMLLYLMLASALWRMRLYTAEYGLTELRFYTTAFMGWLVLVFGWLAATVLRGHRRRFGAGAVAAAFLVLAVLNLANPDALIARTNLARGLTGKSVDADYIASLSADALPAIDGMLPLLAEPVRTGVTSAVEARWQSEVSPADRWNISFARARRHLSATR